MNDLIERYIYAVVKRLPESQRKDVAQELNDNISDMLSDNPNEAEVNELLISLGHPRVLADKYREKPRFLVSSEWFDDYILVFKIVAIIFAAIAFVSGVVTYTLNPESTTVFGIVFEVFWKVLFDMVDAVFTAFGIVTVIFFFIGKWSDSNKNVEFKPELLPQIPDDKDPVISKLGTLISLFVNFIFGFIFLYLLYKNQLFLLWWENGNLNITVTIFNDAVVKPLLPILAISITCSVVLDIYKLIIGRWTISVTSMHTVVKLLSAIVSIIFMTSSNLINTEFINKVAETIDVSSDNVSMWIRTLLIFLSVLVGLGAVTDIGSTWRKTLKHRNKYI